MKRMFKASLMLAATISTAAVAAPEVKVEGEAYKLNVLSAHLEPTGGRGTYSAFAVVEFGNPCTVVDAEDMVVVHSYKSGITSLTLGAFMTDRICTMQYAPVRQIIEIPNLVDPADGVPTISVNGMVAELVSTRVPTDADVILGWESLAHALHFTSATTDLRLNRDTQAIKWDATINATATFSNRCHVPAGSDLYRIVDHTNDQVDVLVFEKSAEPRVCPAVYMPVEASFEVLTTSFLNPPADIVVNGITTL